MDNKGEKTGKQHIGIYEKIAMLSESRKAQVRTCVEQAVSEEEKGSTGAENAAPEHENS